MISNIPKVLKIKYYNPFSDESINKRIEFPNTFQDLLKWSKEFKQIPENMEYEYIEENSNKKINNDIDYQNLKKLNEKVIKLKLNIIEKQDNNNYNLLSDNINLDSNQAEKTEKINNINQKNQEISNEIKNSVFADSTTKFLPVKTNQINNNENRNNFQQNNINDINNKNNNNNNQIKGIKF